MSKKPGLFSRLFGSGKDAAESAPDAFVEKDEAPLATESDELSSLASEDEVSVPASDAVDQEISAPDSADEDGEGAVPEQEQDAPQAIEQTEISKEADEVPIDAEANDTIEPVSEGEQDVPEVVEEPAVEIVSDVESEPELDVEPVVEQASAPVSEAKTEPEKKLSWFERLKRGLARSSGALGEGIASIFTKRKLDDDTLQDLEDILIQADLGVETAMTITERLADGRYNKEVSGEEVQKILADEVKAVLDPVAMPLQIAKREDGSPHVILMIGVNGAGKTTTIGKLAQKFGAEGKSVMLAAGDTFRAAAIDQLKVWGERTGSPVIARDVGSDAAGLAFDAMSEAKEQGRDILMIDTAGRLQNRTELMDELEKIVRVIKKHDESAPHSVLLVLDATTGQNALNQVEIFSKIAGVTGLVMTKLDGTARGGILVAISAKHKMPVHFIGVGEGVEDLEPFRSEDFARAIAGLAE